VVLIFALQKLAVVSRIDMLDEKMPGESVNSAVYCSFHSDHLPSYLFSLYHPIYCFQSCPGWEKNLSGPIVWWNHRGCGVHITTAVTPAIAALVAATVALVAVAVTGRWLLLLAVQLVVRGSGEGANCCSRMGLRAPHRVIDCALAVVLLLWPVALLLCQHL
jgi:hypothetical protein